MDHHRTDGTQLLARKPPVSVLSQFRDHYQTADLWVLLSLPVEQRVEGPAKKRTKILLIAQGMSAWVWFLPIENQQGAKNFYLT